MNFFSLSVTSFGRIRVGSEITFMIKINNKQLIGSVYKNGNILIGSHYKNCTTRLLRKAVGLGWQGKKTCKSPFV